jgi:hypothetical protein
MKIEDRRKVIDGIKKLGIEIHKISDDIPTIFIEAKILIKLLPRAIGIIDFARYVNAQRFKEDCSAGKIKEWNEAIEKQVNIIAKIMGSPDNWGTSTPISKILEQIYNIPF